MSRITILIQILGSWDYEPPQTVQVPVTLGNQNKFAAVPVAVAKPLHGVVARAEGADAEPDLALSAIPENVLGNKFLG